MHASVIAVGSEMLGPTRVDTNSLKITAALESFGIALVRKSVVGDRLQDLVDEMRHASTEIVIVTGGLGPTEDDLTREALCETFGLTMEIDQSIVDWIESRFAERGWKMPEVNRKQGYVFPGQTTLRNQRGTAPGFHIETSGRHVWVFPGVPHELEWMIATYFTPWLESISGGRRRHRRVLKIAGLTESAVEEKLKPYYENHPGELLTILASGGQIEVHLGGESLDEIASRESEIAALFGRRLFGFDDDTLESVAGALLLGRHETLATAESCTGGLLGSRITDISGSSAYYLGGAVCYTAAAKIDLAGVDPDLIREHGEVSEPVAVALARGARTRFHATWGVGITGIAGPTGGTPEKPVGTVHIAVSGPTGDHHRKLVWPASRTMVKWFSTQAALDLLRRELLDV
jgi:competence/damage-inducible protein CinA C-terminal domain